MNTLERTIAKLDKLQRRHHLPGFIVAVIKKYGDDQAGYKAALLTYYAFLSLFPLLLLLTTLTNEFLGNDTHLKATIIKSVTSYFPLLGNQLSSHVQGLHRNGLALVVGILFTFYGTRGVAAAFRHSVQDIWRIPLGKRDGFPQSLLKNLSIIVVGGLGFMLAAIAAAFAAAAGHGAAFRALSLAVNLFILFWLFEFLLNFSLPEHITAKETRAGAATAAVGLVLLQILGVHVLARELKSLDALYSYFALALGLLFWIYLQAQILYYAIEVSVVGSRKLWPRGLTASNPTEADKLALNARRLL